MNLKGMDILQTHFPDLGTPSGRLRIASLFLFWFGFVTTYFILSDNIPTWSIDSQILILTIGFLVISQFFSRRLAYQKKFGERAYRNATLHFLIPGLGFIFAAVIHAAYMNSPFVPRGWWTTLFQLLGIWLLASGLVLWMRAILTFGVDNLLLAHVYHPGDGPLMNSEIYEILRHPIYAGVLRVIFGLALLNGNANSLAFIPFAPLGFTGWIRLVEERELIERFGNDYLEYRRRVPAFWIKFTAIPAYLRILFKGS